jgi:hypothetical protein
MESVGKVSWWNLAKTFCYASGMVVLVAAAANYLLGYKETTKVQAVHKYVMINDASGSMVDVSKERGVGQSLGAIEAGNEALLDLLSKRNDGSKDFVGATVFTDNSYVVSYMVDDPKIVRQKLLQVNYSLPPLNGGTLMDKALWGGIELVANHDDNLTDDELKLMTNRMSGRGLTFKKDSEIDRIVQKCLPLTKGTSLIIFTDGVFSNPLGGPLQMSAFKLLQLCQELKIRVYIISVEQIEPSMLKAIKETGGQGIVRKSFEKEAFREIYSDIVNSQSQETVVVERDMRQSLGTWFGLVAGILLCSGFFLSQTLCRRLTET